MLKSLKHILGDPGGGKWNEKLYNMSFKIDSNNTNKIKNLMLTIANTHTHTHKDNVLENGKNIRNENSKQIT